MSIFTVVVFHSLLCFALTGQDVWSTVLEINHNILFSSRLIFTAIPWVTLHYRYLDTVVAYSIFLRFVLYASLCPDVCRDVGREVKMVGFHGTGSLLLSFKRLI